MDRLLLIISGFTETAGRLGGMVTQVLHDRLVLLMGLVMAEQILSFLGERKANRR